MIEPVQFGFNEEASQTNSFQNKPLKAEASIVQTKALTEFKNFVQQLEAIGVNVHVFPDTTNTFTPDSIFPNNWISTHETGELFTYPMAVPNRRKERRQEIIQFLIDRHDYTHIDLSSWEDETPPRYLEGTGGMIFDRENRVCYAALSDRTNLSALNEYCNMIDYEVVPFTAYGKAGEAIYHTNVMLNIGETFACIGRETLALNDQDRVVSSLESLGKEVIEFSNEQIYEHFAGNMLQVRNKRGETVLVLSDRIYGNLNPNQRKSLEKHNDHLLPIDIRTIEKIGGGSVRCMLAEVFIPLL